MKIAFQSHRYPIQQAIPSEPPPCYSYSYYRGEVAMDRELSFRSQEDLDSNPASDTNRLCVALDKSQCLTQISKTVNFRTIVDLP